MDFFPALQMISDDRKRPGRNFESGWKQPTPNVTAATVQKLKNPRMQRGVKAGGW